MVLKNCTCLNVKSIWQLQEGWKSCFSYHIFLYHFSHHRLRQLAHVSGLSGMKAFLPFIKSCGNSSNLIFSTQQVCLHAVLTPFILSHRKSNFKLNLDGNYLRNHLLLEGYQTRKLTAQESRDSGKSQLTYELFLNFIPSMQLLTPLEKQWANTAARQEAPWSKGSSLFPFVPHSLLLKWYFINKVMNNVIIHSTHLSSIYSVKLWRYKDE